MYSSENGIYQQKKGLNLYRSLFLSWAQLLSWKLHHIQSLHLPTIYSPICPCTFRQHFSTYNKALALKYQQFFLKKWYLNSLFLSAHCHLTSNTMVTQCDEQNTISGKDDGHLMAFFMQLIFTLDTLAHHTNTKT